jgi:hypothetical protein
VELDDLGGAPLASPTAASRDRALARSQVGAPAPVSPFSPHLDVVTSAGHDRSAAQDAARRSSALCVEEESNLRPVIASDARRRASSPGASPARRVSASGDLPEISTWAFRLCPGGERRRRIREEAPAPAASALCVDGP